MWGQGEHEWHAGQTCRLERAAALGCGHVRQVVQASDLFPPQGLEQDLVKVRQLQHLGGSVRIGLQEASVPLRVRCQGCRD